MIEIVDAVPGYKSNGAWKIGCPVNGTMGADIRFRVVGSKMIRLIQFGVIAIDEDEDIIYPKESSHHAENVAIVEAGAPLEQYGKYNVVGHDLWYISPQNPAYDIAVVLVRIEYYDGSTYIMDMDECTEQQIKSHEKEMDRAKQTNSAYNSSSQQTGGCYIATCVYGSYDCPEVWTLRRYRDFKLAESVFGRQFIKIYYAISPKMVTLFGNKKWFRKMCKDALDPMVKKLHENGFKDTPYYDR